jgi:hypothetical protein
MDNNCFLLAWAGGEHDVQSIESAVDQYRWWFLELLEQPERACQHLLTILVVLPGFDRTDSGPLDAPPRGQDHQDDRSCDGRRLAGEYVRRLAAIPVVAGRQQPLGRLRVPGRRHRDLHPVVRRLATPDLAAWAHGGWRGYRGLKRANDRLVYGKG